MIKGIIPATCPICSNNVVINLYDGGEQTLATIGWPSNEDEARQMPRYPHDFVQCPKCTHIWNKSFHYKDIPYADNPNRMFNSGKIWGSHLSMTRDLILDKLPSNPTVIDVGCGEGHFVRNLRDSYDGHGRFVGFDPNTARGTGKDLEFHSRYFEPLADFKTFLPDVVIMRHVLEHLEKPAQLIDELCWGSIFLDKPCSIFVEVPCVDRVFSTFRLVDFFYEHVSHFTTKSFKYLMDRAGKIEVLQHGYDGEVIYALVKLSVAQKNRDSAGLSANFRVRAEVNREKVQCQLTKLHENGNKIAIWGGTGKAAAFIHQFKADKTRFPLVVDSDREKVGSYVPGTGQKIVFRDILKSTPVDVVIIPTQWRARDIVLEMERESIAPDTILIEHEGELIDFRSNEHPYK